MRADLYLFESGNVKSRQRAKDLIKDGCVTLDGMTLTKPSAEVDEHAEHTVEVRDPLVYVGRGGWKLEAALKEFGISADGKRCLDIGASTGGFTDCLLQHGAKEVVAVDAGIGQLAKKLLEDKRVVSMEKVNARTLTKETIGGTVDLVVMDVSFISATLILPQFPLLMTDSADALILVKPQFEVGKEHLGKGGIVKDPDERKKAVRKVMSAGKDAGLSPVGLMQSPIFGGDGNVEYLLHFCKDSEGLGLTDSEVETFFSEKEGK